MVLLFKHKTELWICQPDKPTKITPLDDPNLLSYVPNDDLLYVQSASIINKKQFASWLKGEFQLEGTEPSRDEDEVEEVVDTSARRYLHPRNNGYITIGDIQIGEGDNQRPLSFTSKYDFMPLEQLGEDIVERSAILRNMIKKGRLEIVDEEYYRKNVNKVGTKSAADRSLERILVPVGIKAVDATDLSGEDVSIPIKIFG